MVTSARLRLVDIDIAAAGCPLFGTAMREGRFYRPFDEKCTGARVGSRELVAEQFLTCAECRVRVDSYLYRYTLRYTKSRLSTALPACMSG
jgi:hypothetical protein